MRPEYVDAVDAARNGYTFWLPFLPAVLIWIAALRWKRGVLLFFVAWCASWLLLVTNSNRIQETKVQHAQTEDEFADMASDTWNTFAPMTAVPYTLIYCLIHVAAAYSICGGYRLYIGVARGGDPSLFNDDSDYETYRHALVREYKKLQEGET